VQVDIVSHMSLGTPCLQPEGLKTSSPWLSLGNGDNMRFMKKVIGDD
jgi:hypothetical protein